ncbi:MAG: hypothetical protein IPN36_15305 [Bacteroidetes bacterium]|nr:hypothetical protein [Bacteroidota bacterium]
MTTPQLLATLLGSFTTLRERLVRLMPVLTRNHRHQASVHLRFRNCSMRIRHNALQGIAGYAAISIRPTADGLTISGAH